MSGQKRKAAPAGSVRKKLTASELFGPAADAPVMTYVERFSTDGRRRQRATVPVPPPSPIKRRRLQESAAEASSVPNPPMLDDDLYTMWLGDDDHHEDPAPFPQEMPEKPARKVKPSDPTLSDWLQLHRDAYLRILLRHDGCMRSSLELCSGCKMEGEGREPLFRCRDCLGGELQCRLCCVKMHGARPLHVIEEWNGVYFIKRPLKSLGLHVQLGHPPGTNCPVPRAAYDNFMVIHCNGIHEVSVSFCGCGHAPVEHFAQLLEAGWFPASTERPQTCATLACLDEFHALSLHAKTSAYDYYAVLEYLTNGAGVKPPSRYQVFLQMVRIYRHLLLLKRGGRGHVLAGVASTAPGELAIRCPICPRPGVNLPDNWQDAPPEDQCIYVIFLALDACFRLKRRMVSSQLRDPQLGPGWAYMVEPEPYRQFLLSVTDQDEMSTCSGLAALDFANTKFSRGYSTTGVGMYANMDYIFASILRHLHQMLRKVVSYDIVCQWWADLVRRLLLLPPLVRFQLVLELVRFVIPKMHILGHTLKCQVKFSLNLVPGSGQTDGEGIERPWAAVGGLAASTRSMGPGSRADTLDDHWAFWNWTKLVGLPTQLRRRSDQAAVERPKAREAFNVFTGEQAERVSEWKRMVEVFEADGSRENPYEPKIEGMTESQVRSKLEEDEKREAAAGRAARVHEVSPSTYVAELLQLEEDQRRVRVDAELKKAKTTVLKINLRSMRRKLNKGIERLRTLQATYSPASLLQLRALDLPEDVLAENEPLLAPSALTAVQRADGGCREGLLEIERQMREAQCRTALTRLRCHLNMKTRLLIYKKNHSRHQKRNTRSRAVVARNESKIWLYSEKYQAAWRALVQITDGVEARVGWQRLRKEDIRCMHHPELFSKKADACRKAQERLLRAEERLRAEGELPLTSRGQEGDASGEDVGDDDDDDLYTRGESRREISWIWRSAGRSGSDAELEEGLRIEWCKAYARVRRWDEDGRILEEEWRRFPVSMQRERDVWIERAKAVPIGSDDVSAEDAEGLIAYAVKQADMFVDLIRRAKWTQTEVKRGKGYRRKQYPAAAVVGVPDAGPIAGIDSEDEEEESEEEDDERGGLDSDEEAIMDGAMDD